MFIFRRLFRLGPVRVRVGKRGASSRGIGRFTQRRGRSLRVRIPTGIQGLALALGGKQQRRWSGD